MEKYAVFGLTNETVRKSVNSKINTLNLIRKMTGQEMAPGFNLFNPEYNQNQLVEIEPGVIMFKYLSDVKVVNPKTNKMYEIKGFQQQSHNEISSDQFVHRSYQKQSQQTYLEIGRASCRERVLRLV